MIPLKACGFGLVKMRPFLNGGREKDSLFEWTNTVEISLL